MVLINIGKYSNVNLMQHCSDSGSPSLTDVNTTADWLSRRVGGSINKTYSRLVNAIRVRGVLLAILFYLFFSFLFWGVEEVGPPLLLEKKTVWGGSVCEWLLPVNTVEKWRIRWHFSLQLGSASRKRRKRWKMKRWALLWRRRLFRYDSVSKQKHNFQGEQLWNMTDIHFLFSSLVVFTPVCSHYGFRGTLPMDTFLITFEQFTFANHSPGIKIRKIVKPVFPVCLSFWPCPLAHRRSYQLILFIVSLVSTGSACLWGIRSGQSHGYIVVQYGISP